jgi:histidyl-tRNA synthetase
VVEKTSPGISQKVQDLKTSMLSASLVGYDEPVTRTSTRSMAFAALHRKMPTHQAGVDELEAIAKLVSAAGYGETRIRIDPSVVRGLEYYTGPVFEVELTFSTGGKDGSPRFGSVGGGGRYDGLVSRFRGEPVPATGFSIGVSRLAVALAHLGKLETKAERGPVVVTVFDQDRLADYQQMVASLRSAGIRAELYLGAGKFGRSSNTPTSATALASSSRVPTKKPRAKSPSRI